MFKRVKRIEGWAGLYKGLMPTALSALALSSFAAVALAASPSKAGRHGAGRYSTPTEVTPFQLLGYSLVLMIISLPITVITNRSITTPHKLPWFNPIRSLRVLLTPSERRRPWIVYFTPGLFAAEVLHIVYTTLILHGVRLLVLPSLADLEPGQDLPKGFTAGRFGIYAVIVMFSTVILTPLEVMTTRLSIQRNHATSGFEAVPAEELEEDMDFAGNEEDVIGLRAEQDPYEGLIHCATSMVKEEGWGALYRAWWLTLLGGLMGAFS